MVWVPLMPYSHQSGEVTRCPPGSSCPVSLDLKGLLVISAVSIETGNFYVPVPLWSHPRSYMLRTPCAILTSLLHWWAEHIEEFAALRVLDGKYGTAFFTLGSSDLSSFHFQNSLWRQGEGQGEKKLILMYTLFFPFPIFLNFQPDNFSLGVEWEGDRWCSLAFHLVCCLWCKSWLLVIQLLPTPMPAALTHFGVRIPLHFKKLLRTPNGFCL